ncbi:MAG: efflux RND transporter periplasmic adaptor subunit [Bacteroides sp.]|nr:efflux RND transporter periplasmic adaptor subunit [Bacteroides sp.]
MKSNLILFLCFFVLIGGCAKKETTQNTPVPEYAVMKVQPSNVELQTSYPANIRGKQDVEIRPQVSGFIVELYVDEGATVRKGQPLFKIDPVQYEAAVKVAEANVEVARANVASYQLTLQNKQELAMYDIIGQSEMELAQNDLEAQLANLAQANAQLVNARQDLSYTVVRSPSDGVIGTIPYRIGSLVSASITTPLTTVSDITQMHVYFSMNEKELLSLTWEGGTMNEILNRMPPVQLQLADGSMYPAKGKIETLSGVIDQTTGSVTMRAGFPNSRYILRSGGTGNILIPHQEKGVILIPQKATTDLQDKKFVYLVTDSSTVRQTEIQILPIDDGKNYVVTSGLKSGDTVVTEGVGSTLRNGMQIKPKETNPEV